MKNEKQAMKTGSPVSEPDPSLSEWEAAYQRFETPEQEIQKFIKRLKRAGVMAWPKDLRIIEIFCGRGNGLHAWEQLGFTNLEGVDYSENLLSRYTGPARTQVCDCRHMSFPDQSCDAMVVQGGMHHLPTLPDDLAQTIQEVHRCLKPGGRFVVVEPWRTPFLTAVHAVSEIGLVRKLSNKMDAFATMTHHERRTYEQWLSQPQVILDLLHKFFETEMQRVGWGKLMFVGKPRD